MCFRKANLRVLKDPTDNKNIALFYFVVPLVLIVSPEYVFSQRNASCNFLNIFIMWGKIFKVSLANSGPFWTKSTL
jgi:hypothetical protein